VICRDWGQEEKGTTEDEMAFCDSMDSSPPGSSVHGIFQARIVEWVAISFSRGSSRPRIEPGSPALAGGFFMI